MAMLWSCIQGPRLFRILKHGHEQGRNYEANLLETGAGKVVTTLRFCWSLSYWTSPLLLGILYRRGYFTSEGLSSLTKTLAYLGMVYAAAVFARGIGRYMNPDYVTFTGVMMSAHRSLSEQNKRLLSMYDFEFKAAPVSWRWEQVNVGEVKKMKVQATSTAKKSMSLMSVPVELLAYIATHTFARRMVYPGTTALINTLVEPALNQGRAKLLEEHEGVRAKLLTEDKNEIDTMFLDRRSSRDPKGKTLVVCSEGNAAFYEVGAMATPMDLGYSILGWNHPGFAGSTGAPFPSQEQCAIDSVMQYAIHELGFSPDNIVVYAWSIGGYPASWAAMNYPDVKYVILDATFDDVMPLAEAKMPQSLKSVVETTIRTYLNLNIADQLCKYPGPVLLIRRSRDEMITTHGPTELHTNRGNFLLLKLLQHRYPKLFDGSTEEVMEEWLSKDKSGQELLWSLHNVDPAWCEVSLSSYLQQNDLTFPLQIGEGYSDTEKKQMALFLASKHMEEFDSQHCVPLPTRFFHKPWVPSRL